MSVNVNWGDDSVTTMGPDELLKVQVLIRRAEANDALRIEEEKIYQNNSLRRPGRYQSYLLALWREISAGYTENKGADKRLDRGDPLGIGCNLYSPDADFEQLRALHDEIEGYLYDKGFTKPRQHLAMKDPRRTK